MTALLIYLLGFLYVNHTKTDVRFSPRIDALMNLLWPASLLLAVGASLWSAVTGKEW